MSTTPPSNSSAPMSKLGSNNEFSITLPDENTGTSPVYNRPPIVTSEHRILILGGWPDGNACNEQVPFAGGTGSLIFNSLRRFGINSAQCSLAYVSATPLNGHKKHWHEPSVRAGLEALKIFVDAQRPNIILLLGDTALQAAFTDGSRKTEQWRGSLMICDDDSSVLFGYKVLSCYDPRDVFISWDKSPLFFFDMERLAKNAHTPHHTPISRQYELHVSPDRAIYLLNSITGIRSAVSLDIEGGTYGVSCVSFATSPQSAFIVPLNTFADYDKSRVLRAMSKFLRSTTPKILQNELYDNLVLSWVYKMPICNVVHDTMLSGWEIYPELSKGLAVQTSVWTDHPYYKMGRKSTGSDLHHYCCTDSAITYELALKHRNNLQSSPSSYAHFKFNMALLPALLYMQLRGIAYDKTRAASALSETCTHLAECQTDITNTIRECWKRHGSRGPEPSALNVNSPKQVADVLFLRFGYPKQHPKVGREVDKTKVTTNVDALLNLRKTYNGPNDTILSLLLKYRSLDKQRIALEIKTNNDFRVRCSYNIVGTETGRLSCSESNTGSGANLTTITKKLRYLYTADSPDHFLFQCDLSGADGWTVAAQCSLRGDPTMFDDYMFGLKPAKIIVLMLRMGPDNVNRMSREELKRLSKTVDEDTNIDPMGWQYFAAKQVQHGTNYGLGTDKMSDNILKKGYKEKGTMTIVSKGECQLLKDAYLRRYPGVKFWQDAIKQMILETGCMPSASGHTRRFFGRRQDHGTHREAWAHEPQVNTTYATNMALYRLWTDPENRRVVNGKRTFIIEPVHHVHDALIGQFHRNDTDFATSRIKTYFDNPMLIANKTITIPFEGAYGRSWGELGPDYGGGRL